MSIITLIFILLAIINITITIINDNNSMEGLSTRTFSSCAGWFCAILYAISASL